MARIGNITPAYDNGEQVRQWRVPIHVYKDSIELAILEIYEDEGHLCIDVEEVTESG